MLAHDAGQLHDSCGPATVIGNSRRYRRDSGFRVEVVLPVRSRFAHHIDRVVMAAYQYLTFRLRCSGKDGDYVPNFDILEQPLARSKPKVHRGANAMYLP